MGLRPTGPVPGIESLLRSPETPGSRGRWVAEESPPAGSPSRIPDQGLDTATDIEAWLIPVGFRPHQHPDHGSHRLRHAAGTSNLKKANQPIPLPDFGEWRKQATDTPPSRRSRKCVPHSNPERRTHDGCGVGVLVCCCQLIASAGHRHGPTPRTGCRGRCRRRLRRH